MAIRPKLVLAGGGHAILPFLVHAKEISNSADITLINEHRYFYYSGMIPEYLGGEYNTEEIRIDLQRLCRQNKVTFIKSRAEHLEINDRIITTSDHQEVHYDAAVFDIGSVTRSPASIPDSHTVKPFYRLQDLDLALFGGTLRNLVIVGGGATGVEIALNISARKLKEIQNGSFNLHLIEQSERLLPAFPHPMSVYVNRLLLDRGVNIHLSSVITGYRNNTTTLSSAKTIKTDFLLRATGTVSQPIFRNAGLAVDGNGFLNVNEYLQCPDHPEIFAAGDCANLLPYPELKKTGVNAVKQGPVLKKNLFLMMNSMARREAAPRHGLKPFRPYPVAPAIISCGQHTAIWTAGRFWIAHPLMLQLKHLIDRRWIRKY